MMSLVSPNIDWCPLRTAPRMRLPRLQNVSAAASQKGPEKANQLRNKQMNSALFIFHAQDVFWCLPPPHSTVMS